MSDDEQPSDQLQIFLELIELSPDERKNRLVAGDLIDPELIELLKIDENVESHGFKIRGKSFSQLFQIDQEDLPLLGEHASGMVLSAGEMVGPYRVTRELSKGGMGVVYLAQDTSVRREIALKILTSGSAERFAEETSAVAGLEHPLIVRLYSCGEHAGRPYYAMEYVPGETLQQRIDRTSAKGLPPREVADLLRQVAEAVEFAHQRKVLHRDLKPSNIFIGKDGRPRVGDFGLAKRIDGGIELTRSGEIFGSPPFMAPEQVDGANSETTPSTDVYGLGATLYTAIVGRPPFQGDRPWQILELVNSQDPVPPSRLVAGTSLDLETICLKCLEKNPQQRYASAQQVADDLRRFLQNEPIVARPVGRLERIRRWCVRRPTSAGLVLAASLLAVILCGWIFREFQTRKDAKSRLSETLATRASLYAQQGRWRDSLKDLDEAEKLGHPDPKSLQLQRVYGLLATSNSDDYYPAIEKLQSMEPLAKFQGEIDLIQGLSLFLTDKSDQSGQLFKRALTSQQLSVAEKAVAQAMLASTSLEAIEYLAAAVEDEPTSYFANQYLVSFLIALGRFDEAEKRCEIAEGLFPESPVFPMLRLTVAYASGDTEKRRYLLENPALQQLDAATLDELVSSLEAFDSMQKLLVLGLEFDMTREQYIENYQQLSATAAPFLQRQHILAMIRGDKDKGHLKQEFAKVGFPTFQKAYSAYPEVASLRTTGFLITGKGDVSRIDRLIDQLENSYQVHQDGFFQLCKGRFLYARQQYTDAAKAFDKAYKSSSLFRSVHSAAAYGGARCILDQYKQEEGLAEQEANKWLNRCLENTPSNPRHATTLIELAKLVRNFEAAEKLAEIAYAADEVNYKLAQLAIDCARYDRAVYYCQELSNKNFSENKVRIVRREIEEGLRMLSEQATVSDN